MHWSDGGGRLLGGRYRLGSLLGRGGMAEVYDAFDERLSRRVAVKLLRNDLADPAGMRARFSREARAAAGLSDPSVVAVYDTGEDDGTAYLVMERLPGDTLADRMRAGPLDAAWVATVADDVLGALAAAHAIGLVHRDIKPANILLTENDRAKVADFGIAKAYRDAPGAGADLTSTGLVLGTVAYLSPEQVDGEAATPRSDLYALGVVLYEALAGRKPYAGSSPVAQARAAHEGGATDIAALRPDIPAGLAEVVRRAMSRQSADRYPSAAAMAADLEATGLVGAGSGHPTVVSAADPTRVSPAAVPTTVVTPVAADPTRVVSGGRPPLPPLPPPVDRGRGGDDGGGRRGLIVAVVILALLVIAGVIALLLLDHKNAATTGSTTTTTAAKKSTTTTTVKKPKSTTTSSSSTTPTTTTDPVTLSLIREAQRLSSSGEATPTAVANQLLMVANDTQPNSTARSAEATTVLQQAANDHAAGTLTDYQYSSISTVLQQAGASAPTVTTTTTAPSTTTTSTPSTTAPTTATTSPTTAAGPAGPAGGPAAG